MTAQIIQFPKRKPARKSQPLPLPLLLIGAIVVLLLTQR